MTAPATCPRTSPVTGVTGQDEQWRPVVGFEGWYAVSSLGNVRRTAPAPGSQSRPLRVLRPGRDRSGRPMVNLHRAGQHTPRPIAHLVAEAFCGPRPAGFLVTFRNGDPSDVRAANLVYRTRQDLQARAAVPLRKLSAAQAAEIRAAAGQTPRVGLRELARCYGVPHQTISKIQRGEAYREIDQEQEALPGRLGTGTGRQRSRDRSRDRDKATILLAGEPSRATYRPGIAHIAAGNASGNATGNASRPVAGCSRVPLDPGTLTPASTVAGQARCRRHGCHQRWPAASGTASGTAVRGDAA